MKKDVLFILIVIIVGMIAITLPNRSDEQQLVKRYDNPVEKQPFKTFKSAPAKNRAPVVTPPNNAVGNYGPPKSRPNDGYKPSRYDRAMAGEETEFERNMRESKLENKVESELLSSKEPWEIVFRRWQATFLNASLNPKKVKKLESVADCQITVEVGSTVLNVSEVSALSFRSAGSRVIFSYEGKRLSMFTSAGTSALINKTTQMLAHCRAAKKA